LTKPLRTAALALAPVVAAGVVLAGPELGRAGYAPASAVPAADSMRSSASIQPAEASETALRGVIPGYLSSWGLPPVEGRFTITDSALVFRSVQGSTTSSVFRVALAYVDRENGRSHYLFRVDAGVFETDAPGPLLDLAKDPARLDGLRPVDQGGYARREPTASVAQQIIAGPYADTLYVLFGRPRAEVGMIGARGRAAGRLGEYIAGRDSLAFDPGRMTGEEQFRHALAHELGHRWQARAKRQVATLWAGVPGIRDSKRYGYGELSEHQAEAMAFAINFLQTTAARPAAPKVSLSLLDHYELLVPGTRRLVRHFVLQPIYWKHPLRSLLTGGPVRHALEK
jgi:hypothetical protein